MNTDSNMTVKDIKTQKVIAVGIVDGKTVQLIAKAGWHHLVRTATLHVKVAGKTQRIAKHYEAVGNDTVEQMRRVGMDLCNLVAWNR